MQRLYRAAQASPYPDPAAAGRRATKGVQASGDSTALQHDQQGKHVSTC
jgi:hypothetical protein